MTVVEGQPEQAETQQDCAGGDAHPAEGKEHPHEHQGDHDQGHGNQVADSDVSGGGVQLSRPLALQGQRNGEQPAHGRVQPVEDPQRGQSQPGPQGRESRRVGNQGVQ